MMMEPRTPGGTRLSQIFEETFASYLDDTGLYSDRILNLAVEALENSLTYNKEITIIKIRDEEI